MAKKRKSKEELTQLDDSPVQLDLHDEGFSADYDRLTEKDRKQVDKKLVMLQQMTWTQVNNSKGLNFEEVHSIKPPKKLIQRGIETWYSIRLTQKKRALVCRQGNFMIFLVLPQDHDSTYKKGK